jgi:chromosome segregation ATPase
MHGLQYPLSQLITIKKTRYDQAIKILTEKKQILAKEQEKLQKVKSQRDKVLEHKKDKLHQIQQEWEHGTTSDKIKQMDTYVQVVDERLTECEKKVQQQQQIVENAQQQVAIAKKELFARQKDVDKLEIHKKEWEKEVKYWTEQQATIEHDELGSAQYTMRKQQKKKSS